MEVVVIGASVVGGLLIFRVIWNKAVEALLGDTSMDGVDHGDGTGSIW